jgi:hypothetical protein
MCGTLGPVYHARPPRPADGRPGGVNREIVDLMAREIEIDAPPE